MIAQLSDRSSFMNLIVSRSKLPILFDKKKMKTSHCGPFLFNTPKKTIVIHKRLRSQSTFVHCMRIELPYVSKYRSRLNINYQRFQSSNFERILNISKERYFISDLDSNLDEKGKIYHAPSNLLNEPRYYVEIRTWNRNRRTISIPIPERGARNTFSHSESSEWRHRAIERRPWSSNRWKKSLHLKVRP